MKKKKKSPGKLPDEVAAHPWLQEYDRADGHPKEQLEILKNQIIEIEDNLGTSSIWLICLTMIVIALAFAGVITGSIGFGGELINNLTSMIKSKG